MAKTYSLQIGMCATSLPGVTKEEIISISTDGSAERSRSAALGDLVRQTRSSDRFRDMPQSSQEFTEGLVDRD